MTQDEALRLALEALEPLEFVGKRMDGGDPKIDEAIAAIKEALAQRTWVGLTRMELIGCGVLPWGMSYKLYKAIEAKLKEKNT